MTVFRSAVRSHIGKVREVNEDSALALPRRGLWAVADGLGGHERGDVASRLVTSRLADLPPNGDGHDLLRSVQAVLAACHRELQTVVCGDGSCGCTVAVLLVAGGHFACLWAGDSRVYRLRDGRLDQLTRDHSVVQELVDRGELDPITARRHPWRNRITRAVGIGERLELDAVQQRLAAGDRFLLCTDGLTGEIEDAEIAATLDGGPQAQAADRLLGLALERGARDNVTLALVEPDGDPDRTL